MDLLEKIKQNASKLNKRIVLPEGNEPRTLQAAAIILKEKIAQLILLGNPTEVQQQAKALNADIGGATVIDPKTDARRDAYADLMVELRKSKGLTKAEALNLLDDP